MKAAGNKHSGRIEAARGFEVVKAAAAAYRAVWAKACEHDGIEPASSFVVFSDDNPFTQFVAPALASYKQRLMEYQAGGYVGLQIN